MTLSNQIMEFWDWFEDDLDLIQDVVTQKNTDHVETVITQFDQHLLGMGKLKWVVEHQTNDHFHLTISPNNDREQLAITAQLISASPSLSNWSFFDSIQPKGEYQISLYDSDMEVQTVDAAGWRVCLRPFEGRFQLKIGVNQTDHVDEDTEMVAVDLLLTSLLGERLKIERIADFEIVDEFEKDDMDLVRPIQRLLDLLEE